MSPANSPVRKFSIQKVILVCCVLLLIALFFIFDAGQYLTLDYIKSRQHDFSIIYQNHALLTLSIYVALYVAVTALSLPGAVIMTLAGGALFGFWIALVTVSIASSVGATLACIVSRFLLRDWVQHTFSKSLQKINNGIAEEGAFYLFTLRLVPIAPFFLVNLGMGLTSLRISTFYWVSQLGMLPGTAVYVNAGKELGKIDSLSGVLSPSLLISFALLGIFPIAARKILQYLKQRATANSHEH